MQLHWQLSKAVHPNVHVHLLSKHCNFTYNHIRSIIKDVSEPGEQWKRPVYIAIHETIISSNVYTDGASLISLNNGILRWSNCTITNNSYYVNIVTLNLSYMRILGYLYIMKNHARYILNKESAYIIIQNCSKLTVSQNIAYAVMTAELLHDTQSKQLCYFQLGKVAHSEAVFFKYTPFIYQMAVTDNIYTAPIQLTNGNICFKICISKNIKITISETFPNLTKISISKGDIRVVPSSICKCTDLTDYQCTSHELGFTSPGQTLKTNLIVPRSLSSNNSVILLVETAHLPPAGCRVTKATEMSQVHTSPGCNQYHYTVWSNRIECELYLSMEGIPEIFYVKLLPCPVGFL